MDILIPIIIQDEFLDNDIISHAKMNLASGEITDIIYEDYDFKKKALPALHTDYICTSAVMTIPQGNEKREIDFAVEVDTQTGEYSVNPTELEEIKEKAAHLIAHNTKNSSYKKRI